MATIDGRQLWSDGRPGAGAALYLQERAHRSCSWSFDDGVEVELVQGSRIAVVRGVDGDSYDSALEASSRACNLALDHLAVRALAFATLGELERQHVAWWEHQGAMQLRVASITTLNLSPGVLTVERRDAAGNIVPPPPTPKVWHESFRYFRLSQTTDDLFNAFRNLYLALESIFSHLAPQQLGATGRPAEGEGAWFKRALHVASQSLDLTRYVSDPSTCTDPEQEMFDEFYIRVRNSIFHAKGGRAARLPLDDAPRSAVLGALLRLGRFYVELAELLFGARFASGVVATAGFKMMVAGLIDRTGIVVTDDPSFSEEDDVAYREGAAALTVPGQRSAEREQLFVVVSEATCSGETLRSHVPTIRKIALVHADGAPIVGVTIEGELTLEGVETVELSLGLRGGNVGMQRTDYFA